VPSARDTPCSTCGELLWSGTGSLPPAERVCQRCRRAHRLEVRRAAASEPREVVCPGCGETFETTVKTKVYCSTPCKQRAKRRRRPKPPPKPRAPTTPCVDCGAPTQQQPLGRPPQRRAGCRSLRSLERARDRRIEERAAATAAVMEQPRRRSRRLWDLIINPRKGRAS